MNQIVVLTQPGLGAQGLSVEVHVQTTVRLTAEDARRRVNHEIVPELGTGLGAGEPELHVSGKKITWRVPIVLSLPRLGMLGVVGAVLVDALTGEIILSSEDQERLISHAQWLYEYPQSLSEDGFLIAWEEFDRRAAIIRRK